MTEPIISVKELFHQYGDFTAVDGISFEVSEGEIFSFLGPNGAGKSTAINVLITLLPLQQGSATVAGFDVVKDPEQVRESIGIVFQDVTLDRDMTCREILEFHGNLYKMPNAERKDRIEELLALVQLENKQDTRTKNLSGGMKRRLEIARGLMTRPKVLFLDEPTIGLDPQTRMRMWEYIKAVNREGTTIFLTTHYMDEADHLSDRISIIDKGQIIATGTPSELKNTLGEDLIYLETSDGDGTRKILSGMEMVKHITQKPTGIVAMLNGDGTKILPMIIEALSREGIRVSTVNLKKPSMDDVFVHYTGRELRDEGAEKPSMAVTRAGRR
ncbi:MAG TPA: ATP-binding cassette domain-containing protein [Methanoregulaceae archaeon]|nr:ATP-binding cassette domain-containing protein [Methanoregulaceae archaeon]HOH80760.1 ATP-binding cassette domain-containing protein [Methanoregulaceae archaeon]HOW33355.1 ATP-binding cassette domain-containing protein [Methanoregulaceae archaeon]